MSLVPIFLFLKLPLFLLLPQPLFMFLFCHSSSHFQFSFMVQTNNLRCFMVTKVVVGGSKAPPFCFFFVYVSHNNNPKRANFPPIFLPHFNTPAIGGSFISPLFFCLCRLVTTINKGNKVSSIFSWLFSSHQPLRWSPFFLCVCWSQQKLAKGAKFLPFFASFWYTSH